MYCLSDCARDLISSYLQFNSFSADKESCHDTYFIQRGKYKADHYYMMRSFKCEFAITYSITQLKLTFEAFESNRYFFRMTCSPVESWDWKCICISKEKVIWIRPQHFQDSSFCVSITKSLLNEFSRLNYHGLNLLCWSWP